MATPIVVAEESTWQKLSQRIAFLSEKFFTAPGAVIAEKLHQLFFMFTIAFSGARNDPLHEHVAEVLEQEHIAQAPASVK